MLVTCLPTVLTIRLKMTVEFTTMALSSNWVSLFWALYCRLYNSLFLLQPAGSNSDIFSVQQGCRLKVKGGKGTGINNLHHIAEVVRAVARNCLWRRFQYYWPYVVHLNNSDWLWLTKHSFKGRAATLGCKIREYFYSSRSYLCLLSLGTGLY